MVTDTLEWPSGQACAYAPVLSPVLVAGQVQTWRFPRFDTQVTLAREAQPGRADLLRAFFDFARDLV